MKGRPGLPPAVFLARVIEMLSRIYRGAIIDQESVQRLMPLWTQMYQAGYEAKRIAETTCSCDGKRIVVAPGALIARTPRGAIRAPKGRAPGEAFGLGEVRESTLLSKKRSEVAIAQAQVEFYSDLALKGSSRTASAGLSRWQGELEQAVAALREAEHVAGWINPVAEPPKVTKRLPKPKEAPALPPTKKAVSPRLPRPTKEEAQPPKAKSAKQKPAKSKPTKPAKKPCTECHGHSEPSLDDIGDEINALADAFDEAAQKEGKN